MVARLGVDRRFEAVEGWVLAGLYGFTLIALTGYATFGRHPGWLALVPGGGSSAGTYAAAFGFFSLGQIWLSGGALALILARRVGARWLPALAGVYGASLCMELSGTAWGLPFGEYAYSTTLAPMWLGLVPVVIPLSWFTMALPAYALAASAYGSDRPRVRALRIVLGSLLLLTWDLALDPAMSSVTTYWRWASPGPYYGMPLLNLFGWYVTGLLLMTVLAVLRVERWLALVPLRRLLAYAGANLLLPLGMLLVAGMWGAVAATVGALATWALWIRVHPGAALPDPRGRTTPLREAVPAVTGGEVRHA